MTEEGNRDNTIGKGHLIGHSIWFSDTLELIGLQPIEKIAVTGHLFF